MIFEWDERKNSANKKKHGVSFEVASLIFEDKRLLTVLDDRFDYGEERWISLGSVSGVVVLVVGHTLTEDDYGKEITRIITARKATREETRRYHRDDR